MLDMLSVDVGIGTVALRIPIILEEGVIQEFLVKVGLSSTRNTVEYFTSLVADNRRNILLLRKNYRLTRISM